MEEVKRQLGQHIAVEPEWEAGFTLQIQLRHILAMFQDWCLSDVSFDLQSNRIVLKLQRTLHLAVTRVLISSHLQATLFYFVACTCD